MWQQQLERIERYLVVLIQRKGSSRNRAFRVRVLLLCLSQLSHLYRLIIQARHYLYNRGILRHHTLGCQVISVGNLTVGGTGKTPVVELFARELQFAGRKVAILSRGYKKAEPVWSQRMLDRLLFREWRRPPRVVSDGRQLLLDSAMSGDEPYMLASNLPEVAVLVDKDRVKSGRYAINRFGSDTLILDDGFQYLALRPRVQVVLVDRTNPFGNERVLPRGLLREPVSNIRRADVILITKSERGGNEALKVRLRHMNPRAELIECRHKPNHLQDVFGQGRRELEWLKGKRVVAVSGIAVPTGFEREIQRMGGRLLSRIRFADHHRYSQQEVIDLINYARQRGADAIVTTEKDAVRFPKLDRLDVRVYYLRVDIELLSGAEDFRACINRICFRTDTVLPGLKPAL
ncbi:MAG: tetraacyldisaccharide 4'-kinase [Lentisphaerae bacterium RIFOXYC12_FULL_60_16]|nr:MAG: tetraacyldisaccharide 4'-kinase [Lentisphaerae bacterium RIFOXYC12_FULL_60_16]OGV74877.1 MAG: tetraacyldisaccharide 4'-kinase [Lentisphaerae bacterium RIFOXYA12_FULL_60_10]